MRRRFRCHKDEVQYSVFQERLHFRLYSDEDVSKSYRPAIVSRKMSQGWNIYSRQGLLEWLEGLGYIVTWMDGV